MEKYFFNSRFSANSFLALKKQFHGPFDNNRGQAMVFWMVSLSVLILMSVAAGSALVFLKDQKRITNFCRLQNLKVQSQVSPILKQLLSLNPASKVLRGLMLQAQLSLAAAIASQNYALAGYFTRQIKQIYEQQRVLDKTQKSLVALANLKLQTGTLGLYLQLQKALQSIKLEDSQWADVTTNLFRPNITKLAVKRSDRRLAPQYEPVENFEEKQRSEQAWTINYQIKGFLKFKHMWQGQCSATLEEKTWIEKIKRDKPFSKWRLL